eukprot:GFYU01013117.1.p1 GENE.GFYU01013117.1~~GFYU01013117.1.p1  ORF type:complete len:254 (-),score=23.63 GFYU01013117.1:192-872(-)
MPDNRHFSKLHLIGAALLLSCLVAATNSQSYTGVRMTDDDQCERLSCSENQIVLNVKNTYGYSRELCLSYCCEEIDDSWNRDGYCDDTSHWSSRTVRVEEGISYHNMIGTDINNSRHCKVKVARMYADGINIETAGVNFCQRSWIGGIATAIAHEGFCCDGDVWSTVGVLRKSGSQDNAYRFNAEMGSTSYSMRTKITYRRKYHTDWAGRGSVRDPSQCDRIVDNS